MWRQRIAILTITGSLAALVIPLLVYRQARFSPRLKETEQAVANFAATPLVIPRKDWQTVTLTSPISALLPAPTTSFPAGTTVPPKSLPAAAPAPVVSFILSDGGKDMAIINGNVLKTGDRFQDWRVQRIERNRVLLLGRKGPLWITLQ